MKIIAPGKKEEYVEEAIRIFLKAKKVVALTGAGVSVESGIDDFRSPGGIWSRFPVDEYGTIEVFRRAPEKAWVLFRLLGTCLVDKIPNPAHYALSELEECGMLQGIITQNIDNLHQLANSKNVLEIHGDHRHLHCVQCQLTIPAETHSFANDNIPHCKECGYPLKPNVVLYGENVRYLKEIQDLMTGCDLLIVVGTSAEVYPAASFPSQVKSNSGVIFEFNKEAAVLRGGGLMDRSNNDFFFQGNAAFTLPFFTEHLKKSQL